MIKIVGWNTIYETHETRKLKRLSWVPIQNKHDGSGYRRIAAHERNCEIFTAWILMLELASKNKERGILPQSAEDMAFKTGYPKDIFELAISVLSQPDINWIENGEIKAESTNLPQSPAIWQKTSAEGNGIEGNRKKNNHSDKSECLLFTQIIKRFCEGYEKQVGIKYRDIRKDVKELKEFLSANPDMTIDLFFDVVNYAFSDSFHKNNLSIRYICSHFTTILAKGKSND